MKIFKPIIVIILFLSLHSLLFAQGSKPVRQRLKDAEDKYSTVKFAFPDSLEDQKYLGLKKKKESFGFGDIKADIIIVEILNVECPSCCKKVSPVLNELYSLVQDKGIKLLAIGMGNAESEMKQFKLDYLIPFPVFADESLQMYNIVGRAGQLYFLVLERQPDGRLKEIYAKAGKLEKAEALLEEILKEVALGKGDRL